MAQLLDAAAVVFGEVGYRAASTNAIAREAGVSPGTLYQFFPNKEAIADALSERLIVDMREAHTAALAGPHRQLNLTELLDQVIDPLVAYNLANPVCFILLHGQDIPQRLNEDHDVLHAAIHGRVKAIIAERAPHLDQRTLSCTADMCYAAFYGALQALFEKAGEPEQAALVTELKKMLHRYLAPVMGEEAPDGPRG